MPTAAKGTLRFLFSICYDLPPEKCSTRNIAYKKLISDNVIGTLHFFRRSAVQTIQQRSSPATELTYNHCHNFCRGLAQGGSCPRVCHPLPPTGEGDV